MAPESETAKPLTIAAAQARLDLILEREEVVEIINGQPVWRFVDAEPKSESPGGRKTEPNY